MQGRTGVNIEPATVVRLAEIDNIIGIKEASGNITQIAEIIHRVPENFIVLSGDDAMTLPVIALGGRGVISVVSNQIPGAMTELARLANKGDFAAARELQRRNALADADQFHRSQSDSGEVGHVTSWDCSNPSTGCRWSSQRPPANRRSKQVLESSGLLAAAGAH